MSLKHFLLGLLSYVPNSGYSLHKSLYEYGRPVLPQIYRSLNELASEGLVESVRTNPEKLPARNIFHVTEAGLVELKRWMQEPWEIPQIRDSFVQRLWLASTLDKKDIISNFERFRDEKKKEAEYYNTRAKDILKAVLKKYGKQSDRLYWQLFLDYVNRRCEAEIEWAEAAITQVTASNLQTANAHRAGAKTRSKKQPS